jgi:hypothetical protein
MSNALTITFRFDKALTPPQARIIATAMAELIKLDPPDGRDAWQYTLDCPPEQAYALGVATAELAGALAKHVNGSAPAPARAKPARRHAARRKPPRKPARTAPKSSRQGSSQALNCPECPMTFVRAGSLRRHLETKHGRKVDWQSTPAPSADAAA